MCLFLLEPSQKMQEPNTWDSCQSTESAARVGIYLSQARYASELKSAFNKMAVNRSTF